MDASLIDRLARLRGIGDAYHDYRGDLREFGPGIKARILRAMGVAVDDANALTAEIERQERVRSRALVPPVVSARGGRVALELNLPANDVDANLQWSAHLETAERREGWIATAACPEVWRGPIGDTWVTRRRFELPDELPPGYHDLELTCGAATGRCRIVVSPPSSYEPAALLAGGRLWGVAVQLYTLRSSDNWGIGDFGDLARLIRWVAPRGAGFISLNPLHALAPADPERASPYSASNRRFLNLLYIAVPAVAEYAECAAARARVANPEFQARLAGLRAAGQVAYRGVAEAKFEILEPLYREFCERHLARRTARAGTFRAFVEEGGDALYGHALFDALDGYCRTTLGTAAGWLSWPTRYRDPHGAAVREFAARHADRVQFFLYLQWLAHEQLIQAGALAAALGMPVGLYGDYAVGANPSGSETWMDQSSYRLGAEIGAPPDALALKGQGWGIPPPDPEVLLETRLESFIALIRGNMRYYGALRLDHVMSLYRLWWVAAGDAPTEGAYVHYPMNSLLGALTLESCRNACLVVGEDLGTVPDEMRRAMSEVGLYHYKVLWFEKSQGRFLRPDEFVRAALATASTHDLPTVRSFWEGRDIALRRELRLYPTAELEERIVAERRADRATLLAALEMQGLAPPSPAAADGPYTAELAQALHVYLARSNSALAAIQIEDLLGMADPVNVPGTDQEYPNWRRKLTVGLEDLAGREDLDACFAGIAQARAVSG